MDSNNNPEKDFKINKLNEEISNNKNSDNLNIRNLRNRFNFFSQTPSNNLNQFKSIYITNKTYNNQLLYSKDIDNFFKNPNEELGIREFYKKKYIDLNNSKNFNNLNMSFSDKKYKEIENENENILEDKSEINKDISYIRNLKQDDFISNQLKKYF